jgi:apolipoprotein N-acyltransferase
MARIALVQPGVSPGATLEAEERLTAHLAGPVDLVVWGESSVGYDLAARPDILARLTRLSRIVGADILVNVDARTGTAGIAKTAILVDGTGVRDRYQKIRLVPFGEYVPFRGELGWLSRITKAAGENRLPGHRLVVMDVDGLAIGPLTSFEETFPDMARTQANRRAQLIVYQSATSTFQGSWAPAQLASFGALRAAETGRPVVQAARTGVSAGYDADGRRLTWMGTSVRGATTVDVPVATSRTPYDRFGDYVPVLSGVILALLAAGRAGKAALSNVWTGSHYPRSRLPGSGRGRRHETNPDQDGSV